MAFPNENKTLTGKDGADITVADSKKKVTYTNNGWLFNDNGEYNGSYAWGITEDTTPPFINYAIYTTYIFPNDDQTLQGKDGLDISEVDAKKQESYTNNTWDFTTIWVIQEGKYFPRFGWEPPVAEGSRLIINLNVVTLNIISLDDNNNISFSENKTNSTSTKSYLTFNGNKRRKISIKGYCDYTNYDIFQAACDDYTRCYTYIYSPLDTTENIAPYSYYYISKLDTNFNLGDGTYFWYSMELTFGGYWGDYIPEDYIIFNTSDSEDFYTSDNKALVVQH
jgi:hypothetical protein